MDCLFCKIIAGEIPSTKVFENESVFAFNDIAPMAKTHILFIHKNHSKNLGEMSAEEIKDVFTAIQEFASDNDLESTGYRVVTNIGKDAGQTVFHTHFHILSGERLGKFGA